MTPRTKRGHTTCFYGVILEIYVFKLIIQWVDGFCALFKLSLECQFHVH